MKSRLPNLFLQLINGGGLETFESILRCYIINYSKEIQFLYLSVLADLKTERDLSTTSKLIVDNWYTMMKKVNDVEIIKLMNCIVPQSRRRCGVIAKMKGGEIAAYLYENKFARRRK